MPDVGPNYPAVGESVTSGDANEVTWVNPENIQDADADEATITAATFDSPDPSFYLVARDFGFAISAGSTIDGITVEIERRSITANGGIDVEVFLRDANGSLIGDNKADTGTAWPGTSTIKTYGGTTDTWNTGLSAANLLAMVNDPDFGVALQARANTANADIGVSFIRVTVRYTAGAGTTYEKSGTATADTTSPGGRVREKGRVGSATSDTTASATDNQELAAAGSATSGSRASGVSDKTSPPTGPDPQTLQITNTGQGTLNWTASKTQDWLTLTPTSGSTTSETDEITVTVNPDGLTAGQYTDTITITDAGASNSPQTVPVTFNVNAGAVTYEKSGSGLSGTAASGADVHEAVETGAVRATARAAAADVFEAVETGKATPAARATGADVYEAVETGAAKAAARVSGPAEESIGEGTTYSKTGSATAGTAASAADTAEHPRAGTGTAGTDAGGGKVMERPRFGTATADTLARGAAQAGFTSKLGSATAQARARGADVYQATETGVIRAAAFTSAPDVHEAVEAGRATAGTDASGTYQHQVPQTHEKTGLATAGTRARAAVIRQTAQLLGHVEGLTRATSVSAISGGTTMEGVTAATAVDSESATIGRIE